MIDSHQVADAIRDVSQELRDMPLPEKTEETILLVMRQQRLLAAYLESVDPRYIDHSLVLYVSQQTERLLGMTKRAHTDVAEQLDALALGRSAVSAYQSA